MYECDTTSDMCLPCLHQDITVVNTAVYKHRSIYVSGFLVKVVFRVSLWYEPFTRIFWSVFTDSYQTWFQAVCKIWLFVASKDWKERWFQIDEKFSSFSFSKSNSFFGICPSIFSIDIFRDSQGTSRQNKKLLIKMSASMASEQHVFGGQTRGTKYHHHHLRLCRCYILMCAFLSVHLE